MTPDQARDLLDGTTPGNWQWDVTGNVAAVDGDGWEDVADYVSEPNAPLIVAAPALAAMIAGMREEWGAERQVRGRWIRIVFALNTLWTDDRAIAESAVDDCRDLGLPARIVRRYVTEPEAEA